MPVQTTLPNNERRKLERFNLQIPAKIESMASNAEMKDSGFPHILTSDICSGGAFFRTAEPLPEGTEVKIDLVLPLDNLEKIKDHVKHVFIAVTGTVLRSEQKGMAVGFNRNYQIHPLKGREATHH